MKVTTGLVRGIIIQTIQLRKAVKGITGLRIVIIASEDDLVVDAVQIEELTLGVGIEPCERHAESQATAAISPTYRVPVQILGVFSQIEHAIRHHFDRTGVKRQA